MGTKDHPSTFDCYAKAADDEPYFVLLARDASAPSLVERWANRRERAIAEGRKPATDSTMVSEARECAKAMRAWREVKHRS
jgi:hypothetical protein